MHSVEGGIVVDRQQAALLQRLSPVLRGGGLVPPGQPTDLAPLPEGTGHHRVALFTRHVNGKAPVRLEACAAWRLPPRVRTQSRHLLRSFLEAPA